jgi:membrane-bound serine protease (ClpP class)
VKRGLSTLVVTLVAAGVWAGTASTSARASGDHVVVATLDGVIDPITDKYVARAIDRATSGHATALIIALDTPGGLDTSMRDIIKRMLGAPVPVVVFVSPSGARAASAGLFITQAADVAAMAPGTNIGSAHPVSIGGTNPVPNASASPASSADIESIKVENDAAAYIRALATLHHRNADWAEKAVRQSVNVPAEEALRLNVIDLETRDLSTLLTTLDGREVVKGGQTYVLHTGAAAVEPLALSDFDRLLQTLVDPNIAYLLLLLAIVGIGFWVTHPGLVLPGVVGVIAAILAALSLFNLPVNLAGLFLILAAIVLFIVDIKAVTHGVLTTGGIVAMVIGGLLLIDTGFLAEGVNVALLLVSAVLIGATFAFILSKVIAARRRPYAAGQESLVGRIGTVRERLEPAGMVFVDGALWQATAASGAIEVGAQVRVIAMRGLTLAVQPVAQPAPPQPGPTPQPLAG